MSLGAAPQRRFQLGADEFQLVSPRTEFSFFLFFYWQPFLVCLERHETLEQTRQRNEAAEQVTVKQWEESPLLLFVFSSEETASF